MQLSENQKFFVNFFLHFRNLHKILNTFKKKLSLGCDFLLKLQPGKIGVTEKLEKPRIRTLMASQHVNGSERLPISACQIFCDIF